MCFAACVVFCFVPCPEVGGPILGLFRKSRWALRCVSGLCSSCCVVFSVVFLRTNLFLFCFRIVSKRPRNKTQKYVEERFVIKGRFKTKRRLNVKRCFGKPLKYHHHRSDADTKTGQEEDRGKKSLEGVNVVKRNKGNGQND